jgi:hypothetical protein
VAVKVPRPERLARPKDADSCLAEARTLARLDHPNIVPVHDVGRTAAGLPFVVSKYIEGTDLAATLRQGRLSCTSAAALVATVASALHVPADASVVWRTAARKRGSGCGVKTDPPGCPCGSRPASTAARRRSSAETRGSNSAAGCISGAALALPWSAITFPPGARQKKLKIVTAARCGYRMKR